MSKIVVTQPMQFSPEQKARIQTLGEVTFYDDLAASPEAWLQRCAGADVICTGIFGIRDKYAELKDVFVSVPFVGVGSFADPAVLKKQHITLCNSPGANRYAVSEWIIFMILSTMREFNHWINSTEKIDTPLPASTTGLLGRKITILGKGNIGSRVGAVCEALEMQVSYFTRGDVLTDKVADADIVVDALSTNPSTKGLLDKTFFDSLKHGAIFISVTGDTIEDFDAMLAAVDSGKLKFVAHDVMNSKLGDTSDPYYTRFREHANVFATPHISGFSDVTNRMGNDTMIDNIEAWLNGKPINVFRG